MVRRNLINEKSMKQKYKDGEIKWCEYDTFLKSKPKEKSLFRKWKDGEITEKEYRNHIAIINGFKNHNERLRNQRCEYYRNHRHRMGINKPMSENINCSSFLGIHIAERVLSKIFENVTRMSYGNSGYISNC